MGECFMYLLGITSVVFFLDLEESWALEKKQKVLSLTKKEIYLRDFFCKSVAQNSERVFASQLARGQKVQKTRENSM